MGADDVQPFGQLNRLNGSKFLDDLHGERQPDKGKEKNGQDRLDSFRHGLLFQQGHDLIDAWDAAGALEFAIDEQRRGGHDAQFDDFRDVRHFFEREIDARLLCGFIGVGGQLRAFRTTGSEDLDQHGVVLLLYY